VIRESSFDGTPMYLGTSCIFVNITIQSSKGVDVLTLNEARVPLEYQLDQHLSPPKLYETKQWLCNCSIIGVAVFFSRFAHFGDTLGPLCKHFDRIARGVMEEKPVYSQIHAIVVFPLQNSPSSLFQNSLVRRIDVWRVQSTQ
jgi:hypothetical protein